MTKSIGLDDISEDVFGLSLRGLRSIAILWRAPKQYFDAAETADWVGAFTPSVRLWLSLIALSSLFQFFWIGTDTPLVDAYAQGFRDAGAVLGPDLTYEELAETTALWVFAAFPIAQLFIFLLILPHIRLWGRATTFSLRLRFGFAVMTPSASVLMFVLPCMAFLPSEHVSTFGFAIGVAALLIDAGTMFRGGRPGATKLGRALRSLALASVILMLNISAHMAVQVAGIIFTSIQFGVYVP